VRNLLAAHALYTESRQQQRWLEASLDIAAALSTGAGEDPLRMIAGRAIEIAAADLAVVGSVSPDGAEFVIEIALGRQADRLIGRRFRLAEVQAAAVARSGEPMLLSTEVNGRSPAGRAAADIEAGSFMVVPLRSGANGPGGICRTLSVGRVTGRRTYSATDLAMAAGFASHASLAVELAEARSAERKVMLLEERDRIAIDLHEHVIQELFGIGLSLEGIAARVRYDPDLAARVRQCVANTDHTIDRIRSSIFGLRGEFAAQQAGSAGSPTGDPP
jgi:signal transduction histidine kinase